MWKGSHIVFIYEPNHDQINKRTTMPVEQRASENAMVLKDGCRSHTVDRASQRETETHQTERDTQSEREKKSEKEEVIYHLAFFFSSCSLKRSLKRITDYLWVDSFSSSSHLYLFRLRMYTLQCALLFAKNKSDDWNKTVRTRNASIDSTIMDALHRITNKKVSLFTFFVIVAAAEEKRNQFTRSIRFKRNNKNHFYCDFYGKIEHLSKQQ